VKNTDFKRVAGELTTAVKTGENFIGKPPVKCVKSGFGNPPACY